MKLYFSTDTISVPCVVACYEAEIPVELIEVSWKRNLNVERLNEVAPLGKVPCLVFDDGEILTQSVAVLADLKPESGLLGPVGSRKRAQTLSWLAMGLSDLWSRLFLVFGRAKLTEDVAAQEQIVAYAVSSATPFLEHLERNLRGKRYLMGDTFTIADCFFATELPFLEMALGAMDAYPAIQAYLAELSRRPSIQRARAL